MNIEFSFRKRHLIIFIACILGLLPFQQKAFAKKEKLSSALKSGVKSRKNTTADNQHYTIKSIEVDGNNKIEKDAILNKVGSQVGSVFSEEQIAKDIHSLFDLGYFLNIQVYKKISKDDLTLVYKVQEKPSVVEIEYSGLVELKSEEIAEASGLKTFEILNESKLKEAQEKIQKFCEDKGFFLARVDYKVETVKPNESVKIVFNVKENSKVKVKKITILGANKISESTLKDYMLTKEGGFFSVMSGSGAYKQEMFDRDVQFIRFAYYKEGYVQAKVDRPYVYVTPDKKSIYITIKVEEGEQYFVGEVDIAGDILFSREEIFAKTQIDKNKIFAYDVLQKDLAELQAMYGDLGYAYANVIPRTRFDDVNRKVDLVFEFDKGSKVYFGQINMVGNSKTRDKVIRRELKVKEGELYNETRRRQSVENVQRLGFFEEVNFKTSASADRPEIMNVDIVVKERSTGQIQLGAGYGTTQGFTMQGSVQQTNFLGKGQNLGVSMNLASDYSRYDVSFSEPYYNDTLWSLGFRVFKDLNTARYDFHEDKIGGSVFTGHPIFENTRAFLNLNWTSTKLTETTTIENGATKVVTDYDLFPLQTASGEAAGVGVSVEFDNRNDRFRPSKGWFAKTGYTYSGLGAHLKYAESNVDLRYFKNVFWDVVWRNSVQYAHIESLDSTKNPPFNKLYLLGGPYSLRGYRWYQVGRMVTSNKIKNDYISQGKTAEEAEQLAQRYFGGTQQLMYQTELQFPLIKEADMYGVAFYDIGQAEDVISDQNFLADMGLGIRWFSPIGPLRFELGFPLNRDSLYHRDASIFEFSIGTPF